MKRLTQEYVEQYFAQFGYELLSEKYKNNATKLDVICDKSHHYKTTFANFSRGKRCPWCSGRIVTYSYVKQSVENAGYKLLSKKYINAHTKLVIECDQNHIYHASWNTFNNKYRCLICANERKKRTYDFVKQEIDKAGYKLISNTYKDGKTKLAIRCEKGHLLNMSWTSFQQGNRCKECYHIKIKHSFNFVKNIVSKIGYELVSNDYINAQGEIKIKCNNNHIYKTTFASFQAGSRCVQGECLKRRHKYAFVSKAIEEAGYKLLSIKYKNAYSKILIECDRGHQYKSTWTIFQRGARCALCQGTKITYEQVKERIEREPGYKLISKNYQNAKSKLTIKCSKNHITKISLDNFTNGCRCRECANYGFNPHKPASLYYAKLINREKVYYKLGITNRLPEERLSGIPYETILLWHKTYLFGYMAREEEQRLFRKHSAYKLSNKNELIEFGGYTELFTKDVLKKEIKISI